MTETIIVALIAFLGTVLGSLGGAQLTKYRIQQLEKKVDKHNGFAEKIPVINERLGRLEDDVKELKQKDIMKTPMKVIERR